MKITILQTPDGTLLRSQHGHDYVTHDDRITKKRYMIDGGSASPYIRASCNGDEIFITIDTETSPHEISRQFVLWGTRGVTGREPVRYIPISAMTTDHIDAVLATQQHMNKELRQMMMAEIIWRTNQESKTDVRNS